MKPIYIFIITVSIISSANAENVFYSQGLSNDYTARKEITINFLYETCADVGGDHSRGMIPFFDCQSYVYGVLDSYVAIQELIPKQRRICLPIQISPWNIIDQASAGGVVDKEGNKPAASELIAFLLKKYPCK